MDLSPTRHSEGDSPGLTNGSKNFRADGRSMAEIATRENITDNYVSNLIHLAWLPPKMVDLVLDGDPQATLVQKV
jgi:hypothetical protein